MGSQKKSAMRMAMTMALAYNQTIRGEELEQHLIITFPPDFLLNRVPSGERTVGARFLPPGGQLVP